MKYIIVHHTGGTDANPLADTSHHTFEIVNNFHKSRWPHFKSKLGWHIGYHYFIDKSGKITQGRDDLEEGAHTIGYNNDLGICLAGNFDATVPSKLQIDALKTLLKEKMREHKVSKENIVAHRKFAVKTCYGNKLSDTWASELVGDKSPMKVRDAIAVVRKSIDELEKTIIENVL